MYRQQSEDESHTDNKESNDIFNSNQIVQKLSTEAETNDSTFVRNRNIPELKTKGRENDSIFVRNRNIRNLMKLREFMTADRETDSTFAGNRYIGELKTEAQENDSSRNIPKPFARNRYIGELKTEARETDSTFAGNRNIRELRTEARETDSTFAGNRNIRELKTEARENDSNQNDWHSRKSEESDTDNEELDAEREASHTDNNEEFDKESEESDTDNEEFDTESEQYHTDNEESDTESVKFEIVKEVPLSKALSISENTSIQEACRRMAARRVNGLMLTDSNGLICGILTSQDITTRAIAREVNLEDTPVSNVMTRNPVFVLPNAKFVEAVEKMVKGKFKHLPVVEYGEVTGILDLGKCYYYIIEYLETIDKEKAIADKESERADAKGKANIATAVEGVEKHWATSMSGPHTYIESQMFTPILSTIIPENSRMVTVSPTDSVLIATKKMLDFQLSSAVIIVENKAQGILTSKDILMRVIVQNHSPESTLVEEVMTPNPKCASVDTTIADALSIMRDGKFSHLPVLDRDGAAVAVIDIIFLLDCAFAVTKMYQQSTNNSHDNKNEEELNTENEKFTYTDSEEPAAVKMAMPTARLSPVPSAQAVENAFEEQQYVSV